MKKNIEKKDLKQFGVILGMLLLILNLLHWFKGKPNSLILIIFGVCFLLAGVLFPDSLRRIYKFWFKIAHFIGRCNSAILLFLLYYLILTPIGLTMRLFKKDLLALKDNFKSETRWVPVKRAFDCNNFKHQF